MQNVNWNLTYAYFNPFSFTMIMDLTEIEIKQCLNETGKELFEIEIEINYKIEK